MSNHGPVIGNRSLSRQKPRFPQWSLQILKNSRYPARSQALILPSSWLHRTMDYATVLLPLPGISNDLEVVRLLYVL
jgi:hypothetical protein